MAYRPPHTQRRETLEIVIDTCSMGAAQLQAVESMIAFMKNAHPPVYNNYSIVLPVQVGAEIRQRIFPDFLHAELSLPPDKELDNPATSPAAMRDLSARQPSGLRQFFRRHIDHLVIAETGISLAYKMKYAIAAEHVLARRPEIGERVLAEAQRLVRRYGDPDPPHLPTAKDLMGLRHFIAVQGKAVTHDIASKREEIKRTYGAMPRQRFTAGDVRASFEKSEISRLARHQGVLEAQLTPAQCYLFQALYSEPTLNHEAAATHEFDAFRTDKGERAVEAYLFKERKKHDPSIVSVVISNDKGSRQGINDLRAKSKNKVLAVSNQGLKAAVDYLNNEAAFLRAAEPVAPPPRVLAPQEKWRYDPRNERLPAITSGHEVLIKYKKPFTTISENEWGRRLAELLRYGDWRKLYRDSIADTDRPPSSLLALPIRSGEAAGRA